MRSAIAKGLEPPKYKTRAPRPRITDPFEPYLKERLAAYPALTAKRLWREVKERGYTGGYSSLRNCVRDLRPPPTVGFEARFETPPSEHPNDSTKTIPAPYNASNSGGSNLGPTSKTLVDRVKSDSDLLVATNPSTKIPVDLVTTSASGLDPDITPAAALFQIPSVAKARGLPEDQLRRLVEDNTAGRLWHTGRTACQRPKTQPRTRQAR